MTIPSSAFDTHRYVDSYGLAIVGGGVIPPRAHRFQRIRVEIGEAGRTHHGGCLHRSLFAHHDIEVRRPVKVGSAGIAPSLQHRRTASTRAASMAGRITWEPMPELPPRQRIVLNRAAGSVEDAGALERRLRLLPGTEVVQTHAAGDAARAARDACAAGIPRVVAAGGDGTLHEVVQGLAGAFDRVQLGLLPLGTGNDFARFVGIPTDLDEALHLLQRGEERCVDVVRLDVAGEPTRWILNASSAGFSAIVSERADTKKDGWGALAYSLGAMHALPDLQAYRLRVQVDDGAFEELDAWSLVVANGGSIAGGIPVAPDARVDDGCAELLVVPQMPMTALAVVLPKILLGQHTEDASLWRRAVRRLRVESDPPMPLNADGEPAGTTPAVYEVAPRSLRIVMPRS